MTIRHYVLNGDRQVLGSAGAAIPEWAVDHAAEIREKFPGLVITIEIHDTEHFYRVGETLPQEPP